MSEPRLRVAVLSEGEASASEVFRIRRLLPHLHQRGVDVTIFPSRPGKYEAMPENGICRRLWKFGTAVFHLKRLGRRLFDLPDVRTFDAVVLQRDLVTYPTAALEWLLFRFHQKVVFDFDDAIYLSPRADGIWRPSALRARKIRKILRWSRGVSAGSRALVEYARAVQPRTVLVPTAIPTDVYRPRPRRHDGIVIGWTGIGHNMVYLARQTAALRTTLERFPEARLRILSRNFLKLNLPRVEYVPWTRDSEPEEVAKFDIGVSPMPDAEWTRAKCAARLLVYLACGVPAICSPVGANGDVVIHKKTGLHAVSQEHWEEMLARLITRPEERRRLAAAGRAHVEANYSVPVAAERLTALLREVAS